MPRFRIVTPAGASFSVAGGGYAHEMEALGGLDAEIVECPATQEGFIAAARDADAVYAKGMRFDAQMIQALDKCRIIALGPSGSTTSMSPPPPRRASPSPTAPTPSSRRWRTTP